jgi:hypothetical protein
MSSNLSLTDEIKASITILELAARLHYELKAGVNKCVFHADKTPSLSIRENSFRCFGCGAGGSVIDFYMRAMEVDLSFAIFQLAQMLGIKSDGLRFDPLKAPKLGGVTFIKSRSLQGEKCVIPESYRFWAESKGITRETIERIVGEGSLRFDNNTPIYQYNSGDKARYDIYSSSSSRWIAGSPIGGLWRIHLAKDWGKKRLALCEGESDTMLASQTLRRMGLANCEAVGLPNANQILTPEVAALLGNGRKIIVLLDSDTAGKNGSKQCRESLASHCATGDIIVPQLPSDSDLCELGETFLENLFDRLLLQ